MLSNSNLPPNTHPSRAGLVNFLPYDVCVDTLAHPVAPTFVVEHHPLKTQSIDKSAPDIGASLQWIHGYAGRTCRNNVRYSAGGEVSLGGINIC